MKKVLEPVKDSARITELAGLAREIWNEHYVDIIGQKQVDYMLDRFQSAEAIQQQIDSGYEYYLALADDQAAGYIGLIPDEQPGKMMLSKIYVAKQYRGTGLGAALLEFTIKRAMQTGARAIQLTVNRDNTRSIQWYEKQGFSVTDEVKQDIGNGFFMDDYVLELDV